MYNNQAISAGIACGNAIQGVQKTSVLNEFISRLENINVTLRDAINFQRNLLDRLNGPQPEKACAPPTSAPPSSALGMIDERLGWLLSSAQEIISNQQSLDKIA